MATTYGIDSALRCKLYQMQVGASPIRMAGVQNVRIDPGAEYFSPLSGGSLLRRVHALNQQDGIVTFDTIGLANLFSDLSIGLAPYQVTGDSNVAVLYLADMTELGGYANTGFAATMNKGVIHLDSIDCQQGALAMATCSCIPVEDGENELWEFDGVSNLASSVGALAAGNQMWSLGAIAVGGTVIKGYTGIQYRNLPFKTIKAEGSTGPRYGNLEHGDVTLRVQFNKATPLSDVGIDGIASFGSLTDPPVDATSLVVSLQRVDPFGKRLATGTGDIEIILNAGAMIAEPAAGQVGNDAVSALTFHAHDDGADSSVQIIKNADS